jgi:hypothetical protein
MSFIPASDWLPILLSVRHCGTLRIAPLGLHPMPWWVRLSGQPGTPLPVLHPTLSLGL